VSRGIQLPVVPNRCCMYESVTPVHPRGQCTDLDRLYRWCLKSRNLDKVVGKVGDHVPSLCREPTHCLKLEGSLDQGEMSDKIGELRRVLYSVLCKARMLTFSDPRYRR
jgi:hypothetical protein